jgi:hypothetical protein
MKTYLIMVRSSNEDHSSIFGNVPCPSRTNLPEKDINYSPPEIEDWSA